MKVAFEQLRLRDSLTFINHAIFLGHRRYITVVLNMMYNQISNQELAFGWIINNKVLL